MGNSVVFRTTLMHQNNTCIVPGTVHILYSLSDPSISGIGFSTKELNQVCFIKKTSKMCSADILPGTGLGKTDIDYFNGIFLLFLSILQLDAPVPIHFHRMEISSLDIFLANSCFFFLFNRKRRLNDFQIT